MTALFDAVLAHSGLQLGGTEVLLFLPQLEILHFPLLLLVYWHIALHVAHSFFARVLWCLCVCP